MRRIFTAALAVLLLAGCGQSAGGDQSKLTGTSSAIMTQLLAETKAALPADAQPITEEVAMDVATAPQIGLTAAEFTDQVTDGTISRAMIMTAAHEMVLIQAKDAAAAKQLKASIAKQYDPKKWICVFPQQASVVDSGPYVLLIASTKQYSDAALAAFTQLAGTTGAVDAFYNGVG